MDPPNQLPKNRGLLTLTYRFFLLRSRRSRPRQINATLRSPGTTPGPSIQELLPPFSGEIAPSSQKVQAVMVAATRGPRVRVPHGMWFQNFREFPIQQKTPKFQLDEVIRN